MKRKIGICLLFCIFLFLLALGTGVVYLNQASQEKINTEQEEEESQTEESVLSSKEENAFEYIIFSEAGKLIVYLRDGQTPLFNSGVSDEHLPDAWKMKLEQGIPFQSEEELFEFLEAYSS